MSSSGAIRAGKAFIELFADPKKLMSGLATAGTKLKDWSEKAAKLGSKFAHLGDGLQPLADSSTKLADSMDKVGASKISTLVHDLSNMAGAANRVRDGIQNDATAMAALSLASKGADYLPTVLSKIVSPAGLAAAAIAGLGYAFVKYTDIGKQVFKDFSGELVGFKDEALETLGAIAQALEGGDLTAAWELTAASLEQIWQGANVELVKILNATTEQLIDSWYGMQETLNFAVGEIEKAWVDATVAMLDAWKKFYQGVIGNKDVLKGVIVAIAGPLALLPDALESIADPLAKAGEAGGDHAGAEKKKQRIDDTTAEAGRLIREQETEVIEENRNIGNDRLEGAKARLREARERRAAALAHAKGVAKAGAPGSALADFARHALTDLSGSTAVGTFSAAAAGRLGGGGHFDQIAQNTAASARYLKKMSQQTPTIGFS